MNTFDFTHNKENTKRNSHTNRRNIALYNSRPKFNEELYTDSHIIVCIDPYSNSIPVTLLDADIRYNRRCSLSKDDRFNWVVPELEEMACSKTTHFNKLGNQTITSYEVPACGFLVSKNKANAKRAKFNPQTQSMQPAQSRHIVVIGGKKYSNKCFYYQIGSKFIKIKLPANWSDSSTASPVCQPDEQTYLSKKINWRKDSIDITYHNDIRVDYLSMHPSKPNFRMIHSDSVCNSSCTNESHCIKVLNNDPGYITKFDMYYRSSLTDGKWVKHGTFTGCTNWYEAVKVNIDPILVKEIRIVPTDFHNSWDNTMFHSIGKDPIKPKLSTDDFVEYQVVTQHSPYNRVPDNYKYKWKDIKDMKYYYQNKIDDKFQEMKEVSYYPYDE
jgi:hypothetical protein